MSFEEESPRQVHQVNADMHLPVKTAAIAFIVYLVGTFFVGRLVTPVFEFHTTLLLFTVVLLPLTICVTVWSVFGTGSYAQRLAISHGLGAVVLIALAIGHWGSVTTLKMSLATIIPVSAVSQMCFWGFRWLLGFQLTKSNNEPTAGMGLRDIFVLMVLVSCALASMQLSGKYISNELVQDYIHIDTNTGKAFAVIITPEGSGFKNYTRNVTEANTAEIHRLLQPQVNDMLYSVFFRVYVGSFVCCFLTLPLVFGILRPKTLKNQFWLLASFVLVPVLATYSISVFQHQRIVPDPDFANWVIQFLILVGFTASGLGFIRIMGYRLTSRRQYDKERRFPSK